MLGVSWGELDSTTITKQMILFKALKYYCWVVFGRSPRSIGISLEPRFLFIQIWMKNDDVILWIRKQEMKTNRLISHYLRRSKNMSRWLVLHGDRNGQTRDRLQDTMRHCRYQLTGCLSWTALSQRSAQFSKVNLPLVSHGSIGHTWFIPPWFETQLFFISTIFILISKFCL